MNHVVSPRSHSARPIRRTLALSGAALAAALLLSSCASAPSGAENGTTAQEATSTESAFGLTDGWVKAIDGTPENSMSGVFGSLTNSGDEDITLVQVDSPAAGMIQLHETVTSGAEATMREKEGGFVIPAGGSFELVPGGDHIMFMDLKQPLLAGDEVELTLTFEDGSTVETSVLVKDYDGAQENYADVEGMDDMEGMDHGASDADSSTSSDEHAG